MINKRLKRIIAREGLFIIASIFLATIPSFIYTLLSYNPRRGFYTRSLEVWIFNTYELHEEWMVWMVWIIPFYLVTHFIMWAIKTLKQK